MIENSAIDFEGILGRRDRIFYEEGIEEGKVINNHETAIKLINRGYDDAEIKIITNLSQEEINKLKKENSID